MRSRNIKPGFFKNADLAELAFEIRILFQGLWCLADRKGRLMDRPKQIKGEVFPYDNVDISTMLDLLQHHAFISRYERDGNSYIQIINFEKHQYPHIREQDSTIPAPYKHHASTSPARLIPDVLNPDVLIPESITLSEKIKEWFLTTWGSYPKERRHGKDVAFKRYQKAVKDIEGAKDVARALDNYLASKIVADGFVMRASKWFEEWEDWKDDKRRSSESIHNQGNEQRPDLRTPGDGIKASPSDAMLSKLADSKAFPR